MTITFRAGDAPGGCGQIIEAANRMQTGCRHGMCWKSVGGLVVGGRTTGHSTR
jgi:hypothetical protein